MVQEGKFREDLYHRLNVIRITTTPLRDREGDLSDLARLFTFQIGGANFKISGKAIQSLKDYDWPGNIRELRNVIERAVISARRKKSNQIEFEDVILYHPREDALYRMRKLEAGMPASLQDLSPMKYKEFLDSLEREYFKSALELTFGNVLELVNRIGLSRSTVFKKLKDLGISTNEAKKIGLTSKSRNLDTGPKQETLN